MDRKIRAAIIDDERPARLMIKQLISNYSSEIEVVGEAGSGESGIDLIENLKPDLIFLDIEMPDMDGFSMLVKLSHQPLVVFTTAYEQYAVKAFEENTLDYLVKPIEESRFAKSIEKLLVITALKSNSGEEVNNQPFGNSNTDFLKLKEMFDRLKPKKQITALPVKIKDRILLVRLTELVYLEAGQGYVTLHTNDGSQHLSDLTLSELEEKLPDNFIRVQKSFIVNQEKILEIRKYFNNRLVLIMDDRENNKITTGTTYIAQIRAKLGI